MARVCRTTQKGWDDQVRREPAFAAAVRHARTPLAARDAIINETQARIASSGAAMSSLRAVRAPGGELGARYALTLRAWSRNVTRLERYRDALSGASRFAAINRAAAANEHARSASENDAHTIMAGLQALGGEACELDPPAPTPVIHVKGPSATKPSVAPHLASPGPAARPPVKPGIAAAPRPEPDVSPHDAPDVAPGGSAPEPVDPNLDPDLTAPSPDVEGGQDAAPEDGGSTP